MCKERETYEQFLTGKRVVLVGPSGSLIDSGAGKEIDAYDLVVRLKKAAPVGQVLRADYGARTDILYTNCAKGTWEPAHSAPYGPWHASGARWVVLTSPSKSRLVILRRSGVDKWARVRVIPQPLNSNVRKQCKGMALTGIMAIMDLARMPLSSMHLTGFTFYRTPHAAHYAGFQPPELEAAWDQSKYATVNLERTDRYNPHNIQVQLDMLRALIASNSRVTVDQVLKGVLSA